LLASNVGKKGKATPKRGRHQPTSMASFRSP
jgi:hypothetical protein